jgi:hypothetical protein
MIKKEIVIPIIIVCLSLIFILINILVFFTKGNNRFIKKKLKVGAMILTLTGIIACHTVPKPTCYDVTTIPPKGETDSIANAIKQDSIKVAENQKFLTDSIANANEEKRKKDSIANIKNIKSDTIQPTCYKMPPPKTCYAPVRNK